MGEESNGLRRFGGPRRALRACLLVSVAWIATASAASSAEGPVAAAPPEQPSAAAAPLLSVAPDDAFACAQTLKEGVLSTHAFIAYAYTDARESTAAAGKTSPAGLRGRQRLGQASVCRMWHGPLRAVEVSALLRSLAIEHPERRDIVVRRVVAQD